LAAGLYCEVFLRVGDFRFTRIAILSDEITGETRKMVVLRDLHRPLPARYRFAGVGKVMGGLIS